MVCRGRVLGKGRLGAVTGFGGGGIGALDEKRRRFAFFHGLRAFVWASYIRNPFEMQIF